MANSSPDIAFLTSYIRGQYSKLLSQEDFENLINKPYELFTQDLLSFEIGEKLKKSPDYKSHQIERLLTASLLDQYAFILKHSPKWSKDFLEAYATKFEVANIQRIIRYLYSRSDVDLREVINLRPQEMLGRTAFISKLILAKDFAELLDILKETEYGKEIEVAEKMYSKINDIWPIELAIETFYLKKMTSEAKKVKRTQRKGAMAFVMNELLTNLLLVILKADFVEVDIQEALQLVPIPDEFPFRRQVLKMMEDNDLKSDLDLLKTFTSEKISEGIDKYLEDKMFLHVEIAIKANELATLKKAFHADFGILSIMCYLKLYESQIQDLNKLLYLKEYKFPIEKTKELVVNLV
ncbi:MAG: V-type ATPase subunit [Candidatus Heimdallarchaeota archaeon]|nr:V-type ATPase subunit [Candidatus Heimdallarchaeota archaeon]